MRSGFAITESALAAARAVANPAIAEVTDLDTGEIVDAVRLITGHLYQDLIEERGRVVARIMAGSPRFVCSICQVPIYLVSRPEEHIFYFRHRHEDGSCPAQTRSPLSSDEICARKYHGLRESEPHKAIKALILRSLDADPAFSEVVAERNWRSRDGSGAFRRPDVQAEHPSGRVALEVQLSTTFLSVVVGRREFYRGEGALLLWVFGGFDPAFRLLTTDDLLFSNNSNVFVIDEETARISEDRRSFHLRCHYRRPVREGSRVTDKWEERLVAFDELTQDREGQRVFAVDYAAEEAALHSEIEAEAARWAAARELADRQDFLEFWRAYGRGFRHTPATREVWAGLRERLAARDVELPLYPELDPEAAAMVTALYSVREGAPVIWKFGKLVQVAHQLAENHPRQLLAFGHALKIYDRGQQIVEEDGKGRWRDRSAIIAARMRGYYPEFLPDVELMPLMRFLFPEVAAKVDAYLDRKGDKLP
jgi:hypothetical protein